MDKAVNQPQRLVLLGSTGSIGENTLDVARHLAGRIDVLGLSAHRSWEALCQQAHEFRPRWVTVTDPELCQRVRSEDLPPDCQLLFGEEGIRTMVSDDDIDVVLTAIVGAAGLHGTWAALESAKTVAVANKETLVLAGALVTTLAKERGGRLIPVDSEHSAIFQAIQGSPADSIEKIVLTGSGGPFRGRSRLQLEDVTVEEALNHPTWTMGPKITVDSATLMNKALEVIEARWLFDLSPDQIEVIIHPESVIHSFVEFCDGSVLAQMSPPDMRLPIQYALTYPQRVSGPTKRLCWRELTSWHFEQPDHETFPALGLGLEVARRGGTCGAVLNAANEVAVASFLEGRLPFVDIARACRTALDNHNFSPSPTLTELSAMDRWARQEITRWINRTPPNVQKT